MDLSRVDADFWRRMHGRFRHQHFAAAGGLLFRTTVNGAQRWISIAGSISTLGGGEFCIIVLFARLNPAATAAGQRIHMGFCFGSALLVILVPLLWNGTCRPSC